MVSGLKIDWILTDVGDKLNIHQEEVAQVKGSSTFRAEVEYA